MKTGAAKSFGLAVALGFGLVSPVLADVFLPTNPDGSVKKDVTVTTTFDEVFTFNLASQLYQLNLTDVTTGGFPAPFVTLTLQLKDGASAPVDSLSGTGSFNFTASAGTYSASVHAEPGVLSGTDKASAFTFSVAPVPEPEVWAMIALGMGLVGFQARRKARGPQPA